MRLGGDSRSRRSRGTLRFPLGKELEAGGLDGVGLAALTSGQHAARSRCASAEIDRMDFFRSRRTCLPLLWLIKCDDPHRLCLTLPVAETVNRFFVPLCVLSFGIMTLS